MNAEQFSRKIDDILKRLDVLEARSHLNYDKGTYQPAYAGLTIAGITTHSTQTGVWRRYGSGAFVHGRVAWTAATGTGAAIISMPAALSPVYSGTTRFPVYVYTVGVTFVNGSLQGVLDSGTASGNSFVILSPATNAAGTLVQVEAAGDISFTAIYPIA